MQRRLFTILELHRDLSPPYCKSLLLAFREDGRGRSVSSPPARNTTLELRHENYDPTTAKSHFGVGKRAAVFDYSTTSTLLTD